MTYSSVPPRDKNDSLNTSVSRHGYLGRGPIGKISNLKLVDKIKINC